jgi:PAS domain S-box-containing protein
MSTGAAKPEAEQEAMRRLRRALSSLPLMLGLVAALSAAILVLGWIAYRELAIQSARPTDSAQWALYQTNIEFQKLDKAFADFRTSESKETYREFAKRFDIFYSRIKLLNDGKALETYRDEPFFIEGIRSLNGFTARLATLIDADELDVLAKDEALGTEFKNLQYQLTAFVTAAVQARAETDDRARKQLGTLLFLQLAGSGAVILAFGYFAAVMIVETNRRRRRQKELQESRDLLSATIKSSLDGIMIADTQGKILDVNDAAAGMFGRAPESMVGRSMSDVIMPERYRKAHEAGMQRYLSTGQAKVLGKRLELDALNGAGEEFPIELSISTTGRGDDTKFVSFMRDITDRRTAERNLKAARDKAERASRAKAHFLAAMSHEMRTPLTGILGSLELLSAEPLPENQARHIHTATRSGHALLSVISDVIDISRLEEGKVDIEVVRFDLREIVEDVVEINSNLALHRNNKLLAHSDLSIPAMLMGDASKIRQVLLNLATNAVKFTYSGQVTIETKLLSRIDGKCTIEIAVKDSGPGIAESEMEHLFKDFSQLANSSTSLPGGSGLGLAISKRLVTLLEGSIGVDSALGVGSRFWFRLEVDEAARDEKEMSVANRPDNPALAETGRRILVVDDTETVRSIVTGLLTSRGQIAEALGSAVDAVERLRKTRYDAVIMDVSMPVMDGFEALKIIRAMPGGESQTPIVALTAHALIEDRERCLAAGFDGFLTKPVRVDDLMEAVEMAISTKGSEHRLSEGATLPNGDDLLDIDELKSQFADVDAATLERITRTFAEELERQGAVLDAEGTGISPLHLRGIVHKLSGSASMIGAKHLARVTGGYDSLAGSQSEIDAAEAVPVLMEAIRQTREAVTHYRAALEPTLR